MNTKTINFILAILAHELNILEHDRLCPGTAHRYMLDKETQIRQAIRELTEGKDGNKS